MSDGRGKIRKLRVSADDLSRIIDDNEHMREQIAALQQRGTDLHNENIKLRRELEELHQVARTQAAHIAASREQT